MVQPGLGDVDRQGASVLRVRREAGAAGADDPGALQDLVYGRHGARFYVPCDLAHNAGVSVSARKIENSIQDTIDIVNWR